MVLQTESYNGGYMQQTYSAYQGPAGSYNNFQRVTDYTSPYPGSFNVSTYPSSHGPHHQSGWSSGGDYFGNGANHYSSSSVVVPVKHTTDGYGSSYYENSFTHGNSNNHGSPHHHGYGNSHNSHGLGQGHGSQHHQGYGSSHNSYGQGHGSPNHHGYGNSHNTHGQGHESQHHQGYGSSHNSHGQGHGSPHIQGHGSPHKQGHGSPFDLGKTHSLGGVITNQINKLTHGHNNYGNSSPNYGHSPSGFNHGYQKSSWTVKGLDDDE